MLRCSGLKACSVVELASRQSRERAGAEPHPGLWPVCFRVKWRPRSLTVFVRLGSYMGYWGPPAGKWHSRDSELPLSLVPCALSAMSRGVWWGPARVGSGLDQRDVAGGRGQDSS